VIGHYVVELYPSLEEARRVMDVMRGPDHGGKGRCLNLPTRFVHKDEREIPVAISGVILYDDAKEEIGTIGFAKNLTEMHRNDQLAVLGEVAIGLAHEINNPLTVITNNAELIGRFLEQASSLSGAAAERQRVEVMRVEVRRIVTLLERLHQMAEQEEYASTRYLGPARMIDLSDKGSALAGKRLLVVDDDPAVRDSVAEILRAENARVEVAENGREALERIGVSDFDLVLSDVVMPEMDGYDLMLEVRRLCPDTKMALMTAFYYDKDHVIKRSRIEGIEGVLFKKPIDAERLCSTLGALLTKDQPGPSGR
jgi:CheY-like chemotaxis protein